MQRIVPMIAYEDAGAAIDWLTEAFGFQPSGTGSERCRARRWQDNPWVVDGLFVAVDDVDAHHAQAVAAGATVIRPLEDSPAAGLRLYTAEDLEGHRWMFGQARD